MQYKSIKGYTGAGQLGMLLVFIGLGFVLTAIIQMLVASSIIPEGTSLENMGDALMAAIKDPQHVNTARMMQVLGTFSLLFVPAVLFSLVCNGKRPFWLGFNRYINIYQVLIGFLIIFTANIMAAPMEELVKKMVVHFPSLDTMAQQLEKEYNEQVVALSNLTSWPEFILAIFIMAFFPALFEEVFFRGVLQTLLVKWWKRPLLAILVTSIVFSLIHMSVYLFLSRVVLGFVLGWMFYQTRNIWVNIIAHFLNNAIAVAQLFALSRANEKPDVSKIDPKVEWWFGLIAIVILFFLFKTLIRYSQKNRMKIYTREQVLLADTPTGNPFTSSTQP